MDNSALEHSPFRRLPPEQRKWIFELVLYHMETFTVIEVEDRLTLTPPDAFGLPHTRIRVKHKVKYILAITETCSEIRDQCGKLFYVTNSFEMPCLAADSNPLRMLSRLEARVGGTSMDATSSFVIKLKPERVQDQSDPLPATKAIVHGIAEARAMGTLHVEPTLQVEITAESRTMPPAVFKANRLAIRGYAGRAVSTTSRLDDGMAAAFPSTAKGSEAGAITSASAAAVDTGYGNSTSEPPPDYDRLVSVFHFTSKISSAKIHRNRTATDSSVGERSENKVEASRKMDTARATITLSMSDFAASCDGEVARLQGRIKVLTGSGARSAEAVGLEEICKAIMHLKQSHAAALLNGQAS